MAERLSPRTPDEVREAVAWALASETPLDIRTSGTKEALGRPMEPGAILSTGALSDIAFYEPDELVLSAGPGLTLDDLEALLAQRGQMLPFEPPRWGALLGTGDEAGTLGGLVGTGLSGPRRPKAGAARDFVLGVEGVSGFGDSFKAGGRVMKNVSGYDLPKLLTGSYGTLGVLTRITIKVLPAPEVAITVLVRANSLSEGVRMLSDAASSPFEPSGLAYLPEGPSARTPAGRLGPAAAVRLEGPAVSLEERAQGLEALWPGAETIRLSAEDCIDLWRQIRDVAPILAPEEGPIWRLSVPPAEAASTIQSLAPKDYYADWAGGLLWVQTADETVPRPLKGTAMLVSGRADLRARVPVFPELDPARAALGARVKAAFDPKGILNPGRMREGI